MSKKETIAIIPEDVQASSRPVIVQCEVLGDDDQPSGTYLGLRWMPEDEVRNLVDIRGEHGGFRTGDFVLVERRPDRATQWVEWKPVLLCYQTTTKPIRSGAQP